MNKNSAILLLVSLLSLIPSFALALQPEEVLVIANRNVSKRIGLAKYYMEKREIPAENLLKLWVTDKEVCERADYEEKIGQYMFIANHTTAL